MVSNGWPSSWKGGKNSGCTWFIFVWKSHFVCTTCTKGMLNCFLSVYICRAAGSQSCWKLKLFQLCFHLLRRVGWKFAPWDLPLTFTWHVVCVEAFWRTRCVLWWVSGSGDIDVFPPPHPGEGLLTLCLFEKPKRGGREKKKQKIVLIFSLQASPWELHVKTDTCSLTALSQAPDCVCLFVWQ